MHSIAVLEPPTTGPLFVTADTQADEGLRRAKEDDERRAKQQISEVAEHLDAVNPAGPMTEGARYCTAVMVAGSLGRLKPLLRALPFAEVLPEGSTRGDYARRLRAQASPDGDLPPSPIHIPRIPPQPQRPDNTLAVAA